MLRLTVCYKTILCKCIVEQIDNYSDELINSFKQCFEHTIDTAGRELFLLFGQVAATYKADGHLRTEFVEHFEYIGSDKLSSVCQGLIDIEEYNGVLDRSLFQCRVTRHSTERTIDMTPFSENYEVVEMLGSI